MESNVMKTSCLSKLAGEKLMTLHRHFMWCNIIKKNFENEISKSLKSNSKIDMEEVIADYYGAYMSIWYGMLFGVLEALKDEKIIIPEINWHITDIYEPLRLYRNAVFHPQPEYWSSKLLKITEDEDSVKKIWTVHNIIGKYLLEEMQERIKLQKLETVNK